MNVSLLCVLPLRDVNVQLGMIDSILPKKRHTLQLLTPQRTARKVTEGQKKAARLWSLLHDEILQLEEHRHILWATRQRLMGVE